MDSLSLNVFQQARMVVAQADREMKELAAAFDEAFPLSREEKDELRPAPVDAFDRWSMELIPKNANTSFLMTPEGMGEWLLEVAERGKQPVSLGRFHGGNGTISARGRLRAARVVSAVGDWLEKKGKSGSIDMETVLVLEANARVEIKAETQSRPQVQPAKPETRIVEAVQPRWLDMLPGGQEGVAEPALAAVVQKEHRPQVAFNIGKIFGY